MISKHDMNILHLDGIAGLSVGILLLLFGNWVSEMYAMPRSIIFFLACANILYGLYALSLALRSEKSVRNIAVLSIANGLWMIVCIILIAKHIQTASFIGIGFLMGEACFVAFLAVVEWKNRHKLSESKD